MFVSTHPGDESAFKCIACLCICIQRSPVCNKCRGYVEHRFNFCWAKREGAEQAQLLNGLEREGQSLNRSFAQEVHNAAVKFEPLNLAPIKIATKHLIAVGGEIAPLLLGALNFQTSLKLHARLLHELSPFAKPHSAVITFRAFFHYYAGLISK
jgi:hypothetical protein